MTKFSQTKKKPPFFKFVRFCISIFYKKPEYTGIENIPNEPCIIIGNHAQMYGPLSVELYFPTNKYMWCIGNLMVLKETPAYAYKDFWSKKPKATRWFYKIIAYLLAPLLHYLMSRADTLAVYHDTRIISTFKTTVNKLKEGNNVITFPESATSYNNIVNDFHEKFVDVARLYVKSAKKSIKFVPMYNAPELKTVVFGKPIEFNPEKPIDEHRKEICDYLKTEITNLAKQLPKHKVVPYANISKRKYLTNK